MDSTKLQKKDGKEDKTVAEISEAATKELVFGRILPTAGLGLQNIQAALEKFGYHGQLLNFRSNSEPDRRKHVDRIKNDLYPYLESGIPIIALCDGENSEFSHAVVVVGHGWNKRGETHEHTSRKIQLNQGQSIDIHSPVVWIDDLYINNDNRGPYQQWKDNSGDYKIENIKAAMPLLPKDVYMSAAEAQVAAERALSDAFNGLLAAKRLEGKLTLQDIDHKFVMRSYLTSRHEFRIWASQHQSTSMSRYYRQKHLPEKLWVFEINLLQGYYKTDEVAASGDQRRVGELIIDPTGDPHDFPLLAMHLNLMCIANEPTGLLVNVDPEPLKIDMIFLDETVKNYPLHIPYQRLRSAT